MGRTWLSVITAVVLIASTAAVFLVRRSTQGADLSGAPGDISWKVTLVATGALSAKETAIHMAVPLDFRHQHIFDEHFESKELFQRNAKSKDPGRRETVWIRPGGSGKQPVRLAYSFHYNLGVRRPTAAMLHHTHLADAAPGEGMATSASTGIESGHEEVVQAARQVLAEEKGVGERVNALFDYVAGLANEPSLDSRSALECLRSGSGRRGSYGSVMAARAGC